MQSDTMRQEIPTAFESASGQIISFMYGVFVSEEKEDERRDNLCNKITGELTHPVRDM